MLSLQLLLGVLPSQKRNWSAPNSLLKIMKISHQRGWHVKDKSSHAWAPVHVHPKDGIREHTTTPTPVQPLHTVRVIVSNWAPFKSRAFLGGSSQSVCQCVCGRERETAEAPSAMALLRSLACFLFLLCSSFTFEAVNGRMYGGGDVVEEEEDDSRTVADGARGGAGGWPGYLYTRAVGRCTPQ